MKIMVSACLLGENCKYNGGNNLSKELLRLLEGHTVIPVCPEVLGGLPTPRIPAEIVNGTVMNQRGESVDEAFRKGSEKVLELARQEQPDKVILQSRSPSCGVKEIYDGTFSGRKIPGRGLCADLLLKAGFNVLDVEDVLAANLKVMTTEDLRQVVVNDLAKIGTNPEKENIFFWDDQPDRLPGMHYTVSDGRIREISVGDRGAVYPEKEYDNIEDALAPAYDCITLNMACAYELSVREENPPQDFRRIAFAKQLELLKILGEGYYLRRKKRIEEILRENPYDDSLFAK